jgi:hypothetical protein
MLCQPVGERRVKLPSGEYVVSTGSFFTGHQKVVPVFALALHEDGTWYPILHVRPQVHLDHRSLLLAAVFIERLRTLCGRTRFVRSCLLRWLGWTRDRRSWRKAVQFSQQCLLRHCFDAWQDSVLTRKALSQLQKRYCRQVVDFLRTRSNRRKKATLFARSRLLRGAWSSICVATLNKQKSGLLFSYTRLQLETVLLAHFLALPEFSSATKGKILLGLLSRVHQQPLQCLMNPSVAYSSLWARLEVVSKALRIWIDHWLTVNDTPVSHHLQYLNRKYRGTDWHLRIQQKYQDSELPSDTIVTLVLMHASVIVVKLQALMELYHQTIGPPDPRYRDTVFLRELQCRQRHIIEHPADLQLSMLGWQQRHPLYRKLQTSQLVPFVLCSLLKSQIVEPPSV